jgi:dihydropteroate synthase
MGVLNVTPDSFSDPGLFIEHGRAVAHGVAMADAGADILDVGGESSRPGAAPVSADEEIRRVVPVVRELAARVATPISIDTVKPEVAQAAIAAGATIVNDIRAAVDAPGMLAAVAATGAGYVLMHMRGTPQTMQSMTDYADLPAEVTAFFHDRIAAAVAAGISRDRIVVDPGIGFGKTAGQNLVLIAEAGRFRAATGRPVLLGPSRKSFIGKLLPGTDPGQRAWGTAAAVACGVSAGADILRVHDVAEMRQVAIVAAAVRDAGCAGTPGPERG